MTPTSVLTPIDRRRPNIWARLRRLLWTWIFDIDLSTVEKLLVTFQVATGFGVLALTREMIAVPPPALQGFVLTLPTWLWAALVWAGIGWQMFGRLHDCPCRRRNGALFQFFVMLGLCGPLFIRGPILGFVVAGATFWQLAVAVKLWELCDAGTEETGE